MNALASLAARRIGGIHVFDVDVFGAGELMAELLGVTEPLMQTPFVSEFADGSLVRYSEGGKGVLRLLQLAGV